LHGKCQLKKRFRISYHKFSSTGRRRVISSPAKYSCSRSGGNRTQIDNGCPSCIIFQSAKSMHPACITAAVEKESESGLIYHNQRFINIERNIAAFQGLIPEKGVILSLQNSCFLVEISKKLLIIAG